MARPPYGAFVCGLALLATTCGSPREEAAPMAPQTSTPSGAVVARVDGRPIFAHDLQAQMALSRQSKREALHALIRLELLAAEATRRGLGAAPEVLEQGRRQLATTLIKEAFGKTLSPASIPAKLVARAYEQNKPHYKRPALVRVKHLLCSPTRPKTTAKLAAAKRCIEAAHALIEKAGRRLTPAQFDQLDDQLRPTVAPAVVRVETLRTPKRGYTVARFADAAFTLKKPGDIGKPIETTYGWHIIYLLERQPALDRSLAEVDGEVRKKIFPEASRILFDRWAKQLERRHQATADVDALLRAFTPAKVATAGRR